MKFAESVVNVGRTGILSDFPNPWKMEILKTPTFFSYARAGTIPHLTYDSLKYLKSRQLFLLQTLPSTVEFKEAVESQGKGLCTFVGIPEHPFHLSIQDPGVLTPSGYNVKKGVSVWTLGGKKLLSASEFMKVVKLFRPASYQVLCDSDTPIDCSKKRLTKAVDNSLRFLDECVEEHKNSPELDSTALFGTVQGGYDSLLRKKSALETAARPVHGFVIDGFHENGPSVENVDFSKIKPILLEVLALLPKDKPRMLNGAFNFETILEALKCGIDIFDSSYASVLAESGEASVFPLSEVKEILSVDMLEKPTKRAKSPTKLCLREENFKDDFSPILKNCSCYTCIHYTRAYINHLLITSELLAPILLTIHNHHHMSEFFETIRNVIEKN